MTLRHHNPKCYYCVCTVCNSRYCPWRRKPLGACQFCSEERGIRPRLECDFFNHYLKIKRYRYRRVDRYCLVTLYNIVYRGDVLFRDLMLDKAQYILSLFPEGKLVVSRCIRK